jgi:hypothetical protein
MNSSTKKPVESIFSLDAIFLNSSLLFIIKIFLFASEFTGLKITGNLILVGSLGIPL